MANNRNEKLEAVMEKLFALHKERRLTMELFAQLELLPEDLKTRCLAYYNHEISEMLDDPYIYDKYYGLREDGVI